LNNLEKHKESIPQDRTAHNKRFSEMAVCVET